MKAEETRQRLMFELKAQFDGTSSTSDTPDEPVVTFPSPNFEKPKMFMPKEAGRLEMTNDFNVHGIGFAEKSITQNPQNSINNEEIEIYNMQDLIATNPVNMKTITYDENVVKKQMGLVKKRDWQDILFEDIDWFKQIDLVAGIKKIFGRK